MKIDWRSVGLVAAGAVIVWLVLKPSASAPLEKQLSLTADSLYKAKMQVTLLKLSTVQLNARLRRDSLVKDSLYARILAVDTRRAPVRTLPAAVDSTDIVALRQQNRALVVTVNMLQIDLVRAQDAAEAAKLAAIELHRVDLAANDTLKADIQRLQAQADSAVKTLDGAVKVSRRRWYQKTWSIVKQVGEKALIFEAGRQLGKLT